MQSQVKSYAHNTLRLAINVPCVVLKAADSDFGKGELETYWHEASADEIAAYQAHLKAQAEAEVGSEGKLYLRTLCELSTGHIKPRDRELLSLGDEEEYVGERFAMMRASFRYGGIVSVPPKGESDGLSWEKRTAALLDQGFSTEFLGVLRMARDEGYDFVMFDADADVVEGLPMFE